MLVCCKHFSLLLVDRLWVVKRFKIAIKFSVIFHSIFIPEFHIGNRATKIMKNLKFLIECSIQDKSEIGVEAEEDEPLDFPKNYRMRIKREDTNRYSLSDKNKDKTKIFLKWKSQSYNKWLEMIQNSPEKDSKPKILAIPQDESSVSDSESSEQSDEEEVKNKIVFKMKSINNQSRKGSEDIMLVSGSGSHFDSKTQNNFFSRKVCCENISESLAMFGGNQNEKSNNLDQNPNSSQSKLETKLGSKSLLKDSPSKKFSFVPYSGTTPQTKNLDTVKEEKNDCSLKGQIQPEAAQDDGYFNSFRSGYKMVVKQPQRLPSESNIDEKSQEGVIVRNWVYSFNPNNNKEIFDRVTHRYISE